MVTNERYWFPLVTESIIDIRKQTTDNGFTILIPFPILIFGKPIMLLSFQTSPVINLFSRLTVAVTGSRKHFA